MVPPLFDEVVELGALIFMTMEANYLTQHAVPKMDTPVGLLGSMVFRTRHGQSQEVPQVGASPEEECHQACC